MEKSHLEKISRFKAFIRHEGISQANLAKLLRISRSTVSHYVSGKINIPYSMLLALKAEFGVNPNWIEENEQPIYLYMYPAFSKKQVYDKDLQKLVQSYQKLRLSSSRKLLLENAVMLITLEGKTLGKDTLGKLQSDMTKIKKLFPLMTHTPPNIKVLFEKLNLPSSRR